MSIPDSPVRLTASLVGSILSQSGCFEEYDSRPFGPKGFSDRDNMSLGLGC